MENGGCVVDHLSLASWRMTIIAGLLVSFTGCKGLPYLEITEADSPGFTNGDAGSLSPEGTSITDTDTTPSSCTVSTSTGFCFDSHKNDYIGQGNTIYRDDTMGAFEPQVYSDGGVEVAYSDEETWWYLSFAAPDGERLEARIYDAATRYPFQDDTAAGLDVSGDGRGCNTLEGSFEVLDVSYRRNSQGDDRLNRLWATFKQHCEGESPALHGEVRFNIDD